jgi:hypothetical protein
MGHDLHADPDLGQVGRMSRTNTGGVARLASTRGIMCGSRAAIVAARQCVIEYSKTSIPTA